MEAIAAERPESKAELFIKQNGWTSRPAGNGDNVAIQVCPFNTEHGEYKFFMVVEGEKTGLWTCHVCNRSGNLYQLKSELGLTTPNTVSLQDTIMARTPAEAMPNFEAMHRKLMTDDEYGPVLDYLVSERKFNVETIEALKLGAAKLDGELAYVIPYFDAAGVGVFYKLRTVPPAKKRFKGASGRENPLYNEAVLKAGMDELVMTEGECLTGDTEVLTKRGWVRLDSYSGQDVVQWHEDGAASFAKPVAFIKKAYTGDMIRFTTPTGVVDLETTADHRVLYKHSVTGDVHVRPATEVPGRGARFYRTARLQCDGVDYSPAELRLYVAIQADASHENPDVNHKHGNSSGTDGWHVELKKQRKIERLRAILEDCNIEWTESSVSKRGTKLFRFRTALGKFSKTFSSSLYEMNEEQREVLCEEVLLWDGHASPDGQAMYQSVVPENADLVQYAFSMSGMYARRGEYHRPSPRHTLHWVCVQLNKKRGSHELTCGSIDKTTRQYDGLVYCVQVPSSFIVTRRNGAVCVTGNCDAIALISAGYKTVVGIPGAGQKKASWTDKLDRLAPKQIYLLYDSDKVGQDAAHEMAIRIGLEKCRNIVLPAFEKADGTPGKDINEFLAVGHTLEDLEKLKADSRPFDVQGVQSLADVLSDLKGELTEHGTEPKYKTMWPSLNKRVGGFEDGDVCGLMAEGKVGKTTMAECWVDWYAENGVPSMLFCGEMKAVRLVRKWVSYKLQIDDTPGRSEFKPEHVDQALELVPNYKADLLFGYSRSNTPKEVFETIRQAVRRYGVKVVCYDNLQLMSRSMEHQTQEISRLTKEFKALAMELNIFIILIIQPNRVAEGQIVAARNAMGSSAIEKDVDCMICLHRKRIGKISDSEFNGFMDTEENFEPHLLVRVDLSRFSPGGTCTLWFDGARSTVREMVEADISAIPKPTGAIEEAPIEA
jgi:5S rRNA maturation endonuclease (ribonuclease M5)